MVIPRYKKQESPVKSLDDTTQVQKKNRKTVKKVATSSGKCDEEGSMILSQLIKMVQFRSSSVCTVRSVYLGAFIAGFHLTSWRPCWCTLNKRILTVFFVWENNMAANCLLSFVSLGIL